MQVSKNDWLDIDWETINKSIKEEIEKKEEEQANKALFPFKKNKDGKDIIKQNVELNNEELWKTILKEVLSIKRNYYAYLSEGRIVNIKDGIIYLSFNKRYEYHKNEADKPNIKELINKICLEKFKRDLHLKPIFEEEINKFIKAPNNILNNKDYELLKELKIDKLYLFVIYYFNEENKQIDEANVILKLIKALLNIIDKKLEELENKPLNIINLLIEDNNIYSFDNEQIRERHSLLKFLKDLNDVFNKYAIKIWQLELKKLKIEMEYEDLKNYINELKEEIERKSEN